MEKNLNICLVDNTQHPNIEAVHAHLRKFKIKQEDYYLTYYKRKDLLTQEDIPFKSVDQYFSAHFVNKINMKRYYKENPERAADLSIQMLKERIERKQLKKLPAEIELISCGLPSSQYYYKSIRNRILNEGYTVPFNYDVESLEYDTSPTKVVVDSREQTPLNLKNVEIIQRGLKFGDYAVDGKENGVVIERKSLADFITSFVSHYDRIHREFQRAKEAGAYLVVLIEESFNSALNYPHIPYLAKYIKIRPEAVFHNVRNLIQEFGFQFLFVDGRVKAAETAIKLLQLKTPIETLDLQWCVDRAKLI